MLERQGSLESFTHGVRSGIPPLNQCRRGPTSAKETKAKSEVKVFFFVVGLTSFFFSFYMVRTRSGRELGVGMDGTNVGGNVPSSAETPASGPGDTSSSERTRSGGMLICIEARGGGNVSGEATGDSSLVSVMVQMLREERQARQQQVDLLMRLVESSLPLREVR